MTCKEEMLIVYLSFRCTTKEMSQTADLAIWMVERKSIMLKPLITQAEEFFSTQIKSAIQSMCCSHPSVCGLPFCSLKFGIIAITIFWSRGECGMLCFILVMFLCIPCASLTWNCFPSAIKDDIQIPLNAPRGERRLFFVNHQPSWDLISVFFTASFFSYWPFVQPFSSSPLRNKIFC